MTDTTTKPGPERSSGPKQSSIWHRLYNGETNFEFVGNARRWFALSGIVILVGLVSLGTRGLNFGIDFEGGVAWEVESRTLSVSETREAIEGEGLSDAKIQVLGGTRVRVQSDVTGDADEREKQREAVAKALASAAKVPVAQVSVNEVGPSWGQNITNKARNALIAFFIAIAVYIS